MPSESRCSGTRPRLSAATWPPDCSPTRWVVRLPDGEIEGARAAGAGAFEPMPGRPMKSFVEIPAADVEDDAAIARWVERGLAHAASMPPKK